MRVTAFGRVQALGKSTLAALSARKFNSIALTYSIGYKDTGGRSVYVLLCQGFSSNVRVIAIVTVPENGEPRVRTVDDSGS